MGPIPFASGRHRGRKANLLGGRGVILFAGDVDGRLYARCTLNPLHVFIASALALTGILATRRLRRLPAQRGHCRRCGYNLKGNTSGVCPECGTMIAPGVSGREVTGRTAT